MKLLDIRLNNFRQFYDQQRLEVSSDPNKNVTLVHAENGVGKTALLNAVLWALYDQTTAKFEDKNKILNFQAIEEAKTTASVEVNFSIDGNEYLAIRNHVDEKKVSSDESFKLFKVLEGNHQPEGIRNKISFINSVIPHDIAKYFFFDGEQAEAFSSTSNTKAVAEAVRNILGCGLAEMAIDDLNTVARAFSRSAGKLPGNDEVKRLEKERERLDLEDAQSDILIKEMEKEIDAKGRQADAIEAKLREVEGAKNLQRLRDQKKRERNEARAHLRDAESGVIDWVGRHAVNVVSRKLAETSFEFIEEKESKAEIPSPYNKELVDRLLSQNKCICERPLTPGSPEYGAVMSLLSHAADAELRRRVSRVRSRIDSMKERLEEAPTLLENAYLKQKNWADKVGECERELSEISQQIKGLDLDEIRQREEKRVQLVTEIRNLQTKLARAKFEREDRQRLIKSLEKERDNLISSNALAVKLIRRRDVATKAAEHLQLQLTNFEVYARKEILSRVNGILEKTARRDYFATLGSDFSLGLKNRDGVSIPRSGGENQLLSLAFIAALIDFSKYRANGAGGFLIPGTVAPLMLDSPFGQLDEEYRASTAKFIPKLAEQVILLVSSTQGDTKVQEALYPYVGAEYILISENKGDQEDKPDDPIVLHGKKYIRSVYGCERNRTRIVRIK
jgi:DNA sulfur modification protein DndD